MIRRKGWHAAICFAVTIPSAVGVFGRFQVRQSPSSKQSGSETQIVKSKRLAIIAGVEKAPSGAPLILRWSLKNISGTEIRFVKSNTLADFKILFHDERGRSVPLTPNGVRAFEASYFTSRKMIMLRPEEELKQEIDLTSMYQLKPNKVYTIRVERQIATSDPRVNEQVRSDPIKVKL
jgi:hypothetical protein